MLYYTSVVFFYACTRVLFNASQYGLFEWEFNPLKPEAVNDKYSENIIICVPKVRHKIHHYFIHLHYLSYFTFSHLLSEEVKLA